MRTGILLILLGYALAVVAAVVGNSDEAAWLLPGGMTVQVSVRSDGGMEDGHSGAPAISADGLIVAFESQANLADRAMPLCEDETLQPETEPCRQVFLHHLESGETVHVSVASNGTAGNDSSSDPALSADGSIVAFVSRASNLVPGDGNGASDIFIHERESGVTTRVSVGLGGAEANGLSWTPSLAGDGRLVAFSSAASNLVEGDNNGVADVFVYDRDSQETRRVSLASDGTEGNGQSWQPALSADGRRVAFVSEASNLVVGDENSVADVFVHDLESGETVRVSVASDGTEGNFRSWQPSLSGDGQLVAFASHATTLLSGVPRLADADLNNSSDVFVHNLESGETVRVSVAGDGSAGNDHSGGAMIAADGQMVAFHSSANNLVHSDVNGFSDVFVHDLQSGQTARISVTWDGSLANGWSGVPALSADGRVVSFVSQASNLVRGEGNTCNVDVDELLGCRNVFARVAGPGMVFLPVFGR